MVWAAAVPSGLSAGNAVPGRLAAAGAGVTSDGRVGIDTPVPEFDFPPPLLPPQAGFNVRISARRRTFAAAFTGYFSDVGGSCLAGGRVFCVAENQTVSIRIQG